MNIELLYSDEKYNDFVRYCKEFGENDSKMLNNLIFLEYQSKSKCPEEFLQELIEINSSCIGDTIAPNNKSKEFLIPEFNYSNKPYSYDSLISYDKLLERYYYCKENFELLKEINVKDFAFSLRTFNCLSRYGFKYATDFIFLTIEELYSIRNMGTTSIKEILEKTDISELEVLIGNLKEVYQEDFNLYEMDKKISSREISVRAYNVLINNGIKTEFQLMGLTIDDIYSFNNAGLKTQMEILDLSSIKKNDDEHFLPYSEYLLNKINLNNMSLPIKIIMPKRFRNRIDLNINTIEDLFASFKDIAEEFRNDKKTLYEMLLSLEKDIKLSAITEFEWSIKSNESGKKENREWTRNVEILEKRAAGETLESAASNYGLTRERTRQIEKKLQNRFNKIIVEGAMKIYLSSLFENKNLLFSEDISKKIGKYGNLFVYFLKNSDVDIYNYYEELDCFVQGENWLLELENYIESLPIVFFAKEMEEYVEGINNFLKEKNIELSGDLILKILLLRYSLNGEVYTKKKLSLLAKYKMVLERNFIYGINVYESEELNNFRRCYKKMFSDDAVPDNNRALVGRIVDNCVLFGRGKYILKKEKYISDSLMDDLLEYIESYKRDVIMTNTIFDVFEERLLEEGVSNKYYIQGILRQKMGAKYLFSRDYISKTKDKRPIYSDIIDFIQEKHGIVSMLEIKKEFQGVPDVVIGIALSDPKIIGLFNKKYMHSDCLRITVEDVNIIRKILEKLLNNGAIIDSDRLTEEIYIHYSNFMSKNNIDGHYMMYSIAKYIFNEEYQYKRPFIANIGVDIGSREERIIEYIEQFDELEISDIKEFIDDQGINIYSMFDFLNNSLKNFIRIGSNSIKRINHDLITSEQLMDIKGIIHYHLSIDGYVSLALVDYFLLPNIELEWNQWLLQSIIHKFIPDICLIYSNNYYNSAIAIAIRKDEYSNSYDDFLVGLIKNENSKERFLSKIELREWLLKKNVINKDIPALIEKEMVGNEDEIYIC